MQIAGGNLRGEQPHQLFAAKWQTQTSLVTRSKKKKQQMLLLLFCNGRGSNNEMQIAGGNLRGEQPHQLFAAKWQTQTSLVTRSRKKCPLSQTKDVFFNEINPLRDL